MSDRIVHVWRSRRPDEAVTRCGGMSAEKMRAMLEEGIGTIEAALEQRTWTAGTPAYKMLWRWHERAVATLAASSQDVPSRGSEDAPR